MAEENTTDNTTDKKETTGLGQFDLDKIAGIDMSGRQAKEVDTKGIDEQITALEKPAGGSVYDKMAARYRSQGEGAVLRTQKNLTNLFGPTVNLIQEREAAAQARFTLLKDKLPEFDDTKIFGMQSGNEMPIVAEIESISKTTKEDMRMLSRLNPNDERYDEIKKRIDKNQKAIVAFDEINQKLLEIRNSPNDESQWSKGMDQTTADMWRDIYASKGENIKIVDGKLVWTDTRGKTSYDFDFKDRGDMVERNQKGIDLWLLQSYEQETFLGKTTGGAPDSEEQAKEAQAALNRMGITDADGNELEVDGKWGPKSQSAYDKYLKNKDNLEKAWLDENLTDEEKKKLGTTTGVGETRVIDLNEIGDGPTMIDNLGIEKDIEIQDGIQMLINSNIEVDDPRYDAKINQLVRTLNSAGPKGIKSLIFDGFGADPTDPLKSTNTNSFIEQIIRNNPEEFGIKDIENLTEEEIANAYEIMRSRDVTYQYNNSEEKPQTLQSQYIQWYRNEIDTKVREGKKSKLVATQQETNTNTSNKSNRSNRSSNNTTTGIDDSLLEETETTNRDNFKDGVNITETVKNLNQDNFYEIFMLEEEPALEILKKLLPEGFKLKEKGADIIGIDNLQIIDNNGNVLGNYGFDFGNEENAKDQANRLLRDLQNIQVELDLKQGSGKIKNIDYIVDNIWEPNNVEGYGVGRNAQALMDYLYSNFKMDTDNTENLFAGETGNRTGNLSGIHKNYQNNRMFKKNGYILAFTNKGVDGEYIQVFVDKLDDPNLSEQDRKLIEAGALNRYKRYKKWGGDSTGGESYDKKDIVELFTLIGLEDHLTENVK
tara:strand:- start:2595 stop:5069 length:2475 start_codon:yes stop_codon:yes gene_type:complete